MEERAAVSNDFQSHGNSDFDLYRVLSDKVDRKVSSAKVRFDTLAGRHLLATVGLEIDIISCLSGDPAKRSWINRNNVGTLVKNLKHQERIADMISVLVALKLLDVSDKNPEIIRPVKGLSAFISRYSGETGI